MRTLLNTPLLDAALELHRVPKAFRSTEMIPSRSFSRFNAAKSDLLKGLETGEIFNVVMNDAKSHLSSAVEDALESVTKLWNDATRPVLDQTYPYGTMWNDVSTYGSFNQFAGRIKRLRKALSQTDFQRITNPAIIDATLKVIEMYQEVDNLWQVIAFLKPMIVKGRRPAENPTPEDLTNTGICGICGRRFKLNSDHLVEHGFKISNGGGNYFGCRVGKCFAVGYQPYELSSQANIDWHPNLLAYKKEQEDYLALLQSGTIGQFNVMEKQYVKGTFSTVDVLVTYLKGSDDYQRTLDLYTFRTEANLRQVQGDIEVNQAKIDKWSIQPLMYGRK